MVRNKIFFNLLSVGIALSFLTKLLMADINIDVKKAQLETNYDILAKMYLPSQAEEVLREKQINEEIEKYNAEKLKEKANNFMAKMSGQSQILKLNEIKLPVLGGIEKLNIIYKIFSINEPVSTINEQPYQDLEFFCGYAPELSHNLFSYLDKTTTKMGKAELQNLLAHPITDIVQLQQRQAFIKNLLDNPTFLEKLEHQLEKLQKEEQEFLLFWKNFDVAAATLFDKHYFTWFSSLNQNKYALEFSALWTMFGNPSILLLIWPATFYFQYFLIHKIAPISTPPSFGAYMRDIGHTFGMLCKKYPQYIIPFVALIITLQAIGMYPVICDAIEYNKTSNLIQQKMIHVARFSNTIHEIDLLFSKNAVCSDLFDINQTVVDLPENFEEFQNMLTTNTFNGSPSFFSYKGKALAAFKMMLATKDYFIPMLKKIGQVDALVSVAKFLQATMNNPHAHYCFAEYETNSTKPHLALTGFWHPILNQNTVVINDFELGGTSSALNITLTGPNAGGKSTVLKGLTIALILAQTLGIAPASKMSFTPFTQINTYLNITDAEGKTSLYQAEMRRADALIKSIQALKKNQFSFVVMDEIFTGTNPDEGQVGAYSIAKNLATFDNSACIIATHYKILTELEDVTLGKFKNFKVFVIKNPDGTFTKTYKLIQGISNQNIAIDLLGQEGFGSSIVQDAKEMLERMKKQKAKIPSAPATA